MDNKYIESRVKLIKRAKRFGDKQALETLIKEGVLTPLPQDIGDELMAEPWETGAEYRARIDKENFEKSK